MMPTCEHSRSTISSTCDVRKTVAPRSTHRLSVSRSTRDATAPLVLVDGAVAGTWHWDPVAKHVRLDALSAWTPAQREAVELRAEALGRFIAAQLEDPALHVVKTARTASRASAAHEL